MYSQWDALLLESTVYVAILAWFEDGPDDTIAMYNIVVLLVRVTFMNGATKLLSKCPTWWDLSALDYHFESQPLPTYFAWHAHHLPPFVRQLTTLFMEYSEIILPPFFLIPISELRYFLFFCQVLLMTLTVLTGNFGGFNYNMLVLLVSLLETPRLPVGASFISAILFGKLGYDIFYRLPWRIGKTEANGIKLELTATFESFQIFVAYYIDVIVMSSVGVFLIIIGYTFLEGVVFPPKLRKFLHTAFVILTSSLLICVGMIPIMRLDEQLAQEAPMIKQISNVANSWSLANSYGSFRQMSGKFGRPEIIVEGSTFIEGPWKEIEFYAKPGSVSRAPKFLAPHHPRLDWLMHYAAELTYQQNPFFLSLVHHLMQNTTEVVNLVSHYPFKNRSEPMNFVRANIYMYRFSKVEEKDWWSRQFQEEYLPVFNRGNDALLSHLREHKILSNKKSALVNGPLGKALKQGHRMTSKMDHFTVVFAFLVIFIVYKYHVNYVDPFNAHGNQNNHNH
uniref:Lipase maturation factor n=1 Tax=Caenorhabditis japonica TaxID=281687 RepID=A0A8R1I176_CAEJA